MRITLEEAGNSARMLLNYIHIAVCAKGDVGKTLAELKASPATTKAKA